MKKNYFLGIIAVVGLFLLNLTALNADERNSEINAIQQDTTAAKVVQYEVFGMDCPGCQSALEKQVLKIEGVENAVASWQEKRVLVTLQPGAVVSDEDIVARIEKANFTPGTKIETDENEE